MVFFELGSKLFVLDIPECFWVIDNMLFNHNLDN